MWKFDIGEDSWSFVTYNNDGPEGRWGHFAFSVGYGQFGVSLGYAEDYSNVWYYDVNSGLWSLDEYGAEVASPAAMVGYSAVLVDWEEGDTIFYVFGGASDDWEPRPSLPSVWSREFAVFGDVWSFWDGEFFREGCYPGYVWDDTVCVLDVPEEKECDTEDLVRRTYVQEIEDKLILKVNTLKATQLIYGSNIRDSYVNALLSGEEAYTIMLNGSP
jgi:hypothetical protein